MTDNPQSNYTLRECTACENMIRGLSVNLYLKGCYGSNRTNFTARLVRTLTGGYPDDING